MFPGWRNGLCDLEYELEDLSTGMVNSRKLGVKAIITLEVRVESLYQAEAAEDAGEGGSPEPWTMFFCSTEPLILPQLKFCHKDTFRIKEQLSLSGSKPNIDQLLWKEMRLCGVSARPAGGRMLIDGNLEVFVIYSGEGRGNSGSMVGRDHSIFRRN